jgi:hypothetical protein
MAVLVVTPRRENDDAPTNPFPAQDRRSTPRAEDEAQEDGGLKKMMACFFAGGYYYCCYYC